MAHNTRAFVANLMQFVRKKFFFHQISRESIKRDCGGPARVFRRIFFLRGGGRGTESQRRQERVGRKGGGAVGPQTGWMVHRISNCCAKMHNHSSVLHQAGYSPLNVVRRCYRVAQLIKNSNLRNCHFISTQTSETDYLSF